MNAGVRTLVGGIVCLGSAAALAGPPNPSAPLLPVKHEMQWVEDTNIHMAQHRGAINRHSKVSIQLEITPAQQVRVSDSGTHSVHNLYSNFSTDESTTWSNAWTGTASVSGAAMQLELKLASRKCEHKKSGRSNAPEILPCKKVSEQVTFVCTAVVVTTETWLGSKLVAGTIPAWRCMPEGEVELGETPSPWVLGRASCVQVSGGRYGHGGGYSQCEAPDK